MNVGNAEGVRAKFDDRRGLGYVVAAPAAETIAGLDGCLGCFLCPDLENRHRRPVGACWWTFDEASPQKLIRNKNSCLSSGILFVAAKIFS
jgi:hypothetical protein